MKILLANSTSKVGGVSTFMLSLRSALIALGHECDLFFFSHGTMDRFLPPDCRVHFGDLAEMLRLVERERIDVVHANNIDWTTGISAVRRLGARLVLTAHKVRDQQRSYGWTTKNCDAFTTVSNWVRADLQAYTDLPIEAVFNGVDTDMFSPGAAPASERPIIAWVGRGASPLKRIDVFAAAAPALHRAGLRLWVVDQHGADKAAEAYPDAVATLQPLAEFWGAVPFADMPNLYRTIAASGGVLLSTSQREGLGLGLLEAQACGCAVIGPDVAGVNEAVSVEHGGVLFPADASAEALAGLIVGTVADRQHVARRAALATAFVRERFTRRAMAARYVRIYETAPLPANAGVLTRWRRRARLSPLVNWKGYLEFRWGVGELQYSTMVECARRGEARAAAAAGLESLRTSPTIYLRPARILELLNTQRRAAAAPSALETANRVRL